ncbi:FAD-dependent monooxygenase [Nannocystaceae bacterium ST9]
MPEALEVLVVGGGPAGGATALILARAGHEVALIERGDLQGERVGETVSVPGMAILEQLELGEAVREQGHVISPRIRSAWSSAELRDSNMADQPLGGWWHVDRRKFDRLLLDAAAAAGARVWTEVAIDELRSDDEGTRLRARAGEQRIELAASWVVDATGRACSIARSRGATRVQHDQLVGVVGFPAVIDPGADPSGADFYTMTEALDDGWWYTARLPGDRFVAIYMTDADLLAKGRSALAELYAARLAMAPHTRERIDAEAARATAITVTSAASARLDRVSGSGWIAVGDAAMSFDPATGVGVWHALDSAQRAAYAISCELADDPEPRDEYGRDQAEIFTDYLALIRELYGRNVRWPDAPFWARRRGS